MTTLIQILLYIHALAGGVSLLTGLAAIFSAKGGKAHRFSGLIYYWAMLFVVISGLIVGAYRGNIFIQTIAVFSFYMVFTGRRVLRHKKSLRPSALDWTFNLLSMLTAIGMLLFAAHIILRFGFKGMSPVLLVFGSLLLTMVVQDFIKLKRKKFVKNAWLFDHIGRMGGSYIATVTAFMVVNIDFSPQWLIWLLPTFVGTPILIKTSNSWRKKLTPKATSR